jgi:hypothetical protein
MAIDPAKYDVRLTDSRRDRLLFRLEHWLLTPGSGDVAQLRGYLRVKTWRDCRTPGERLRAIRVAAKLPARALRDGWRAVRTSGSLVARQHGVSRPRQLLHVWWLWVRHGVQPSVYYCFGLHRPGQLRRGPAFLQGDEDDQLYRLLNVREAREEAELLLDKARFERWLEQRGLPTVRTILELREGQVARADLQDGRLPRCDLFSKPNDSLQGRGAQRWTFDGDGWTRDGSRYTEAELLAELTTRSRTEGVLVQAQLRNHPALAPIAPVALSTVRVLTLRGTDGVVRVVLAICKIPTGDAPTDHMRLGGVAAPVDLVTGRLGPAIGKAKSGFLEPRERHPDTGVAIEGFELPQWESVTQLAVRAHEALDRLLCVGWDIAILESGPVIIEGNDNPGHSSSQMPTGVALGETAVVPALLACLRASFVGRSRDARRSGRRVPPISMCAPESTKPA